MAKALICAYTALCLVCGALAVVRLDKFLHVEYIYAPSTWLLDEVVYCTTLMPSPKHQQRGPPGPPGAPATNFVGLVSTCNK